MPHIVHAVCWIRATLPRFEDCCAHHSPKDVCGSQWDDPLDAIAVHAWNGTWGVLAVGAFADADLITNSYGTDVFSGNQRPYGFLFPGGGGHLFGAQIAYACFIARALQLAFYTVVACLPARTPINARLGRPCL